MNEKQEPLYSISVASRLVGISPRVLRSYEEAKLINPFRTEGQTRIFSNHDIKKIKIISYLNREKEINLAGIKALFKLISIMWEETGIEFEGEDHQEKNADKKQEELILSKIEEIAPDL